MDDIRILYTDCACNMIVLFNYHLYVFCTSYIVFSLLSPVFKCLCLLLLAFFLVLEMVATILRYLVYVWCVRVCMCACMHACVHKYVHVFVLYKAISSM